MRFLGIALTLLVTSCRVDVTFPAGLRCDDGECPRGQFCDMSTNTCVLDSGGGDAGTVDADTDGGGTARACGGSEAFVEPFTNAAAEWVLDSLRPGVSIDNGVVIGVAPGEGSNFATLSSRLDLRDSQFIAQVAPSPTGSTSFGIKEGQSLLTIQINGATISFDQDFDGGIEKAYVPNDHRYVGFRERNGTLEFVTSPDGIALTVHRTVDTPSFVDAFQGLMTLDNADSDDRAVFSDFNGGNQGHAFCKASDLSDDFNDGVISRAWSLFSCSDTREAGGELVFSAEPGQFCVIAGNSHHDLSGSAYELELGSVFSGYFKLAVEITGREFVVERFDTELRLSNCLNGLCSAFETAAYEGERFWRFAADDAGVVTFSFSGDGADYETVGAFTAADLARTRVRFHGNVGSENRANAFN